MKRLLVLAMCICLFVGCDDSQKQAELERVKQENNRLREEEQDRITRQERETKRKAEEEDYAKQERQKELDREQLRSARQKQSDDKFKADLNQLRQDGKKFDQELDTARKRLK